MENGLGLNLGVGLGGRSLDYESVREGAMSGRSASSYGTSGFRRRRDVAGCQGRRGPPRTTTTTAGNEKNSFSSVFVRFGVVQINSLF